MIPNLTAKIWRFFWPFIYSVRHDSRRCCSERFKLSLVTINTHPTCSSRNKIWHVRGPGASSHLLLGSARVSANARYHQSKLTVKSVKSSLPPLLSLPCPSHTSGIRGNKHLTHPLAEPWRLSFIMLAPPKGRMLCFCPRLWLTRWLWAMIAARAPREHLNELTLAVWRHLAPNPLTTLLY